MVGIKHSGDKLPIHKIICSQFPLAIQEIARCSKAGHDKYNQNLEDEDWQNFSRVPGGSQNYKDAALRHLLEAENQEFNEDMEEYGKIRHLSQFCWNALAALEIHMRSEVIKATNKSSVSPPNRVIYSTLIEEAKQYTEEELQKMKHQTNLDEWMAKHKVENDIDLSFRADPPPGTLNMSLCLEDTPENKTWLEELEKVMMENMMKPTPFPDFSKERPHHKVVEKAIESSYQLTGSRCEKKEDPVLKEIIRPNPVIRNDPDYFGRPTLTVDQLLNRDDNKEPEDYYPDQKIN